MTYTKEQLEQALAFIKAKESQDYMSPEDYYHIWKYHGETIQSLIQDALDPWNYNMDEAPRDGTKILVINSKGEMQVVFYDEWVRVAYKARLDGKWTSEYGHVLKQPTAWKHLPNITKEND